MMKIQNLVSSIDISASGLSAQRARLDAISSNIANANTTRTEEGGPYRRKITVFEERNMKYEFGQYLEEENLKMRTTDKNHLLPVNYEIINEKLDGVDAKIERDKNPFKIVYNPDHPDADHDGYVKLPNINIVSEMVDMISASRTYEANVTCLNAAKSMAKQAMMI